MKTFTALILASIIVSVSIIASPALAYTEPSVGVKEGDWIEYDINVTGTGTPPPTHDVRWFRIQILPVQGTAFSANFTVRYTNGTIGSAIWKFNFTEGNVEGWTIIPSNLGPGDTFYDLSAHTGKPVNVTIQRQEQKTVLGASRTVTYGNDSFRHKEWDKATGVFVGSSEHLQNVTNKDGWHIENLTVTIQAIATNMWSPEVIPEPDQTVFYVLLAAIVVLAVVILSVVIVVARRRRIKGLTLSPSSQGKIAALTILMVILFEVGTIFFFPFYEVGLSFAELNLIMQTVWTALVLVSIWFRIKGNYFVHEILMLIVMCAWAVGLIAVLFMNPFSGSTQIFSSSPLRLVMNSLHGIFSVPALVFGVWLVLLWRPGSAIFAAKSRRLAQLIPVFWIVSYVVGVLDFMVLHTTFFG
jgi:hypothetical protein